VTPHDKNQDSRPRFLFLILATIFVVRWWLSTTPGYPPDLNIYKGWAIAAGFDGIHTIYDSFFTFDYPPLFGYLLAPVGFLFDLIYPARNVDPFSSTLMSMMVKTIPLIFDVLMAWFLAFLVNRCGLWNGRRSWLGWAPALFYLLHPAVLMESGYWGQPDVVETLFIILGLTLILMRKPELGWACAALGLLMKPLAAPYYPLLALATWRHCGFKRLITGGLVGLATFVAGFLPFIVTGKTMMVAHRVFIDITAMPFTSVNAHNIWWLYGPWESSQEAILGPLNSTRIGLSLFGLSYLFILYYVWKRDQATPTIELTEVNKTRRFPLDQLNSLIHWYFACAAVGFAFFVFSDHLHENHLFPVLPLLILFSARSRAWTWLFGVTGLAILINMVTHDLYIGAYLWSKVGGETTFFAPDIDWYLNNFDDITRTPYHSQLEYWMSRANSVVIIGCFGWLMYLLSRQLRPGKLSAPGDA
jgi:hypothetical protein